MNLPKPPDKDFEAAIAEANGKFVTLAMMCYDHFEFHYDRCKIAMQRYSLKHGFRFWEGRWRTTDVEKGRYQVIKDQFFGDYILWIDGDQVFPPDTLIRLASHNKPIVGTMVVSKDPPHSVVTGVGNKTQGFRSLLDWTSNSLITMDESDCYMVTGFGCILIKREVFEAFPDGNPFLKIFCPAVNDNLGEDWSFCVRAKELGFSTYVDTSIPVGHIGPYIYSIRDYSLYKQQCIEFQKGAKFWDEARKPQVVARLEAHEKAGSMVLQPVGNNGKLILPKNRLQLMER